MEDPMLDGNARRRTPPVREAPFTHARTHARTLARTLRWPVFLFSFSLIQEVKTVFLSMFNVVRTYLDVPYVSHKFLHHGATCCYRLRCLLCGGTNFVKYAKMQNFLWELAEVFR